MLIFHLLESQGLCRQLQAAVRERSPRSSPEFTAGIVDMKLLISTNKKSTCLNRAKKLYDMKCDRISRTFNQIRSTDEIFPDLNLSGIHNAQNIQQSYALELIYI